MIKKLLGIIVLGLLLSGNGYAEMEKIYYGKNGSHKSGISKLSFCKIEVPDSWDNGFCRQKSKYINNDIEINHGWDDNGIEKFAIFTDVTRSIKKCHFSCGKPKQIGDGNFFAIANSIQEAEQIINNLQNPSINSNSQTKDLTFTIKDKKEQCTAIGFAPATEKFADCVLRLVELDVKSQQAAQIALAQSQGNQQVVTQLKKQNNSRSSDAFIELGLKLLSPQSTVSAPTTTNCRVIGSGAYKTVNCW